MAKSEYLQREEAAKKQLGAKGVKKRVKQLPTAARAFTKEMTGIDISRKGVSVDPIGLAMAVSPFKLLKASRALRAAGMARPYSVANRVAKEGLADQFFDRAMTKFDGRNVSKEIAKRNAAGRSTELPVAAAKGLKVSREASESVFPRLPNANIPGSRRSFDVYEDPLLEGAGRFKNQNLLEVMIQGSKTRSGMNRVKTASEIAKALSKYKTPKRKRVR